MSAVDCSLMVLLATIVEKSDVLLAMFDVECSSVVVAGSSEKVGCSDVDDRFVDVELCEVGCLLHTRLIQTNSGEFEIFRKAETCLILIL